MKSIKQNFERNKFLPLFVISKLHAYDERASLLIKPDFDISSYEGPVDKEYALREEIDLSNKYKYIFDVNLEDFGYLVEDDDTLYKEKGNSGEGRINYQIDNINNRERIVRLKGVLFGSGYDIGSEFLDTIAELNIIGLSYDDSVDLKLYQELLLEGHLLELEKSFRMSFFSYFTAIEAFVSESLENIKINIPTELHDSLERLSLDDKVRILAKERFETSDFIKIKLWGQFSGLLKSIKDKRNKIAHGKCNIEITQDDVTNCFICASVLVGIYEFKKKDFHSIAKLLHPKA